MLSDVSAGTSIEEGGLFGLLTSEGDQAESNPFVLTALEDAARQSPEHVSEDVYCIEHRQFSGSVSVTPGADAGANCLELYLKHSGRDAGVRLRAEVRSTWIALTLNGYEEASDKAAVLAAALLALASIPDQQMVSVTKDGGLLGVPDDLLQCAELLDPVTQRAGQPTP